MRTICILGSTGSIGTQSLDVIRRHSDRLRVVGLAAGTSHALLVGQIREFMPPLVAISDEEAARELKTRLGAVRGVEITRTSEPNGGNRNGQSQVFGAMPPRTETSRISSRLRTRSGMRPRP